MLRFAFGLAVLVAMLAPPAYAQKRGAPSPLTAREVQKKKEAEAVDRQYKSTLKKTDQDAAPVRTDPWSNMRGPSEGKR
jgi:hypothetical protein